METKIPKLAALTSKSLIREGEMLGEKGMRGRNNE